MSQYGFPFAAPAYIPTIMDAFEKEILTHFFQFMGVSADSFHG